MNNSLEKISHLGMLPVISIEDSDNAVPLARALSEGGLPFMEVMFRTDAAAESIRRIAREIPDFTVGAGTVLSVDQVKTAVEAGAQFIVAPGFNPKVASYCVEHGIPMVPGCDTPTEVEAALSLGITTVKVFPVIQLGGVATLKLLAGPYQKLHFVPTGDLDRPWTYELLKFRRVSAAGGDFMLSYADIRGRRFEQIRQSAEDTILGYLKFHIKQVGLPGSTAVEAAAVSKSLAEALNLQTKETQQSYLAGSLFEVLKQATSGEKGRVVIGTADVKRAYYYLKSRGVQFREDSLKYDADGWMISACLKESFAGFALQLAED